MRVKDPGFMERGRGRLPASALVGPGSTFPRLPSGFCLLALGSQNAVPGPSVSLQLVKWRHTCWFADCGWEDRMWWEIAHRLQGRGWHLSVFPGDLAMEAAGHSHRAGRL